MPLSENWTSIAIKRGTRKRLGTAANDIAEAMEAQLAKQGISAMPVVPGLDTMLNYLLDFWQKNRKPDDKPPPAA